MRAELVGAVQDILRGTAAFVSVCGLSSDTPAYPLVRVWPQGFPVRVCPQEKLEGNLDNFPQARIDLRLGVQIETIFSKDGAGNSIDAPLYALVDAAFGALHGCQLPGRGTQKLVVYDSPGLVAYKNDGTPAIYLLTVSIRVIPENFSLT